MSKTAEEVAELAAKAEPAAPPPDLDASEAGFRQVEGRRDLHLLQGITPASRRFLEGREHHEAALDLLQRPKVHEPGTDPLQEALHLAQLGYQVSLAKLADLRRSREAVLAEQERLRDQVAKQEQEIASATGDEKQAALQYAAGGEAKLRAAVARRERAAAIMAEAQASLAPLDGALRAVDQALEAAQLDKARRRAQVWSAVAKLRFSQAQPGLKLLAECWAARCRSGEGTLRLEEFLMMAYRQHCPSLEANAGIERRLQEEFFRE